MMRREGEVPVLFSRPEKCCGCGACACACPRDAISFYEDECGFLYPRIDPQACIGCGACKRACGFQQKLGQITTGPYFAAASDEPEVNLSASGGVFGSLARSFVARGGIVIGCAWEHSDCGLRAVHRAAAARDELLPLYGSKYVQSDVELAYKEARKALRAGREVLFSGTPCQVAGLRGYLGKEYSGLLAVDLVCHGVPSARMLEGYSGFASANLGSEIVDMRFRSKRDGWSKSLQLEVLCANGERSYVSSKESSYYDLFLGLKTLRDSCYDCPFAGKLRPADLTIGDFWGVDKVKPSLLEEHGGSFSMRGGVSCLLVNTERGLEGLTRFGGSLRREKVSFEQIDQGNDQLRHPAKLPRDRERYLQAFAQGGWERVERMWNADIRKQSVVRLLRRCVPVGIKRRLKHLLQKES